MMICTKATATPTGHENGWWINDEAELRIRVRNHQ
jgi:hypothetical protein